MNAQTKIVPGNAVYAKIAAVQGDLAKVGIAKDRRNSQQGYNFRGIDDVYSALSPLLAAHGLIIVPRIIERQCVEGQTKRGDPLFRVTVRAEFDFIAADDGSIHTACTFGEAMDSADKATNKAMSAAYKYAAFMTFAIPTEGDNDADSTTHEVGRASAGQGAQQEAPTINDEQFAQLEMLIPAAGLKPAQFNHRYRCDKVRNLPASMFDEAVEALNDRIAELAKEGTNKVAANA